MFYFHCCLFHTCLPLVFFTFSFSVFISSCFFFSLWTNDLYASFWHGASLLDMKPLDAWRSRNNCLKRYLNTHKHCCEVTYILRRFFVRLRISPRYTFKTHPPRILGQLPHFLGTSPTNESRALSCPSFSSLFLLVFINPVTSFLGLVYVLVFHNVHPSPPTTYLFTQKSPRPLFREHTMYTSPLSSTIDHRNRVFANLIQVSTVLMATLTYIRLPVS